MANKGQIDEVLSPASPPEGAKESPTEVPESSPPEVPASSPAKRAPATSPAKKDSATAGVEVEVEELPRAIVRRLVKEQLSELSAGGEGGKEDVTIQKDALLAFAGSARVFIHYLSATANEVCKESKRQTINAEDVLKALGDIDFLEFIEPLKASLEEFRRRNAAKKSGGKAKVTEKKRKLDEQPTAESRDEDEGAAEVEQMEVEGIDAQ